MMLSSSITTSSPARGIVAYAAAIERNGTTLAGGSADTYWVEHESFAVTRIPTFALVPPSREELRRVFLETRAAVVSYLVLPDECRPANASLYVCRNSSYSLEHLGASARRDARKAVRSLRIEFIDWEKVLECGFPAFSETRRRVGLSDGTFERFNHRFRQFAANPFHCAVGAWKDETLVAFFSLVVVADWVEIEGSFARDAYRSLCPNDGLVHFVLRHFLVLGRFKTVSYGLSSIQDAQQKDGLHAYKNKVGFEALPVHRRFVVHPWIRPLANSFTLAGVGLANRVWPRNRLVRKARGVLQSMVEARASHPFT